jgi:hypothetical protein
MNAKGILAVAALGAAGALGIAAADLPRNPAPAGVELYFITPVDGATVSSPVFVRFGLRGMGVAPAGIAMENTGHHHLLVDTGPPAFHLPIPADANHVHFGKGQTEATVELAPGRHRLQLLLADHLHVPHDPPVVSKPITITVE